MALSNLEGRAAIITGAGAGINLCFAKLLLSKGCNVVFADLQLKPEANELIDSHQSGTPKAVFQQTDVRVWSQLEKMFSICEQHFDSADIVCPGAGVFEPPFSAFNIPPGTGQSIDKPDGNCYASLDINLMHPIRTTQLAISHFLKHEKPGSVVHISSTAAQGSGLLFPLYFTAKAGVSAFVRSMAELETPADKSIHPIRVTAVAPGLVKTPLWMDNPDKLAWVDQTKDQWIAPEDVAERMLDLVVKEEYVGGTVLEVLYGKARRVAILNDPGPSGPGAGVSNRSSKHIWENLGTKGWGEATQGQ